MSTGARIENSLRVAAAGTAAFALVVVVRNAWVGDDAWIVFRSVEQLFAGNGPRWNPHERVQVFTSPLWYGVLSAARLVSTDVFINAVAASFVCVAAALWAIRRAVGADGALVAVVVALLASNGFFDYTTSGLENPLCYLLLSLYIGCYLRLFGGGVDDRERLGLLRRILLLSGLLLLCRHDMAALILAPTWHAIDRHRGLATRGRWMRYALVGLSPFLAWSVFALVYYGTPLPNPAYAKLQTGIPPVELWRQGVRYLGVSATHDTITLVVVLLGGAFLMTRRRSGFAALGVGVFLDLLYIVSIGGDFMLGRFLSHPYLLVVVSLAVWVRRRSLGRMAPARIAAAAVALGVAYWLAYPHTPVRGVFYPMPGSPRSHGIADERAVYVRSSFPAWLRRDEVWVFPDHRWASEGLALRESDGCCSIYFSVGAYGYHAGTEKRIVDLFGLCDPLLARLPIGGQPWRIGHFRRSIPKGYAESVNRLENLIQDEDVRDLYEDIRVVTQGDDLLSWRRLGSMWRMNVRW